MWGWIGSFTGVVGAILVASNFEYSKFGYLFFIISSITWLIQANKNNDSALILLNAVFTFVNMIGIYRWFF